MWLRVIVLLFPKKRHFFEMLCWCLFDFVCHFIILVVLVCLYFLFSDSLVLMLSLLDGLCMDDMSVVVYLYIGVAPSVLGCV